MHEALAICAFTIAADQARNEIQLFPAGRFSASDGRPEGLGGWQMDASIANRVIAQARQRTNPFVIDYEHQTLNSEANGQPAPAAGWFSNLEWREGDGLYAVDIDWTARAKRYVSDDEYRYFSPVFLFDPDTGAVTKLLHGALTNDPALDGMAQAAAAARRQFLPDQSETAPMRDQIIKALGLKKDTTEEQALEAVTALKKRADDEHQVLDTIRETVTEAGVEIADDAEAEKVAEGVASLKQARDDAQAGMAALKKSGGKVDPAKFVPIEAVNALRDEVAALRADHTSGQVEDLVQAGLDDGRLLPAQEKWARDLGNSDVAQLKAYLEASQPIAALKKNQTSGKQPVDNDGKVVLTDSQKAICKRMNIPEADYAKELEAAKEDPAS